MGPIRDSDYFLPILPGFLPVPVRVPVSPPQAPPVAGPSLVLLLTRKHALEKNLVAHLPGLTPQEPTR